MSYNPRLAKLSVDDLLNRLYQLEEELNKAVCWEDLASPRAEIEAIVAEVRRRRSKEE